MARDLGQQSARLVICAARSRRGTEPLHGIVPAFNADELAREASSLRRTTLTWTSTKLRS